MNDDSTTRKRGRPPLDPGDPSVDVHLMIPGKAYDHAYQLARAQDVTVPEVLRRAIKLPPLPER